MRLQVTAFLSDTLFTTNVTALLCLCYAILRYVVTLHVMQNAACMQNVHNCMQQHSMEGKEKTAPLGVNIMESQVLYWAAQVAQHSTYLPCCQIAETIDNVYSATCFFWGDGQGARELFITHTCNVLHLGAQCKGTVTVCCSVPNGVRLQHAIFPDCAYRLAATCWANAQLQVVPRFSPSPNVQDPNLDTCFDGCHETQSGHMNTAIVMPGGSVFQTGLM